MSWTIADQQPAAGNSQGVAMRSWGSCRPGSGMQLPQLPDVPRACQVTFRKCLGGQRNVKLYQERFELVEAMFDLLICLSFSGQDCYPKRI